MIRRIYPKERPTIVKLVYWVILTGKTTIVIIENYIGTNFLVIGKRNFEGGLCFYIQFFTIEMVVEPTYAEIKSFKVRIRPLEVTSYTIIEIGLVYVIYFSNQLLSCIRSGTDAIPVVQTATYISSEPPENILVLKIITQLSRWERIIGIGVYLDHIIIGWDVIQ